VAAEAETGSARGWREATVQSRLVHQTIILCPRPTPFSGLIRGRARGDETSTRLRRRPQRATAADAGISPAAQQQRTQHALAARATVTARRGRGRRGRRGAQGPAACAVVARTTDAIVLLFLRFGNGERKAPCGTRRRGAHLDAASTSEFLPRPSPRQLGLTGTQPREPPTSQTAKGRTQRVATPRGARATRSVSRPRLARRPTRPASPAGPPREANFAK